MTKQIVLKKQKPKVIKFADFWCGGGGTSTGAREAAEDLGMILDAIAVNHWIIAVTTHKKNHPSTMHYCKAVDSLSPLELVPDGYLKLLVASPECIGHSKARGGKPTTEQKRADAKDIERWVDKLFVENLLIENVEEFMDWGPLGRDGKPLKSKKGEYFKRFINFLEVTYTVEYRVLNCADYGDATTRKRFFLLAKRGKNKKINFPEPSHASRKVLEKLQPDLYATNKLEPWRSAREIIDWSLKGKNVFGRKKPLCDNTMKRIYAGLRKYSGIDIPEREIIKAAPLFEVSFKDHEGNVTEYFQFPSAEWTEKLRAELQTKADIVYQNSPIKFDLNKLNPFTIGAGGASGQQNPRSIDDPVRTITGTPTFAVVEPYLFNMKGTHRGARSLNEPTFTQTSSPRQQYLAEPILLNLSHTKNNDAAMCKSFSEPLPTICGKGMLGTAEPVIIKFHGSHKGKSDGANRSNSVDEPLRTIDASNRFGVAECCFLVPTNHGKNDMRTHSISEPLPTITSSFDAMGFAKSFLVKYNNNELAKDVNEPLPTVTTKDRCGLGQPFLIQFYGETDELIWTVTPQIQNGIIEPFLVSLKSATEEIHGLLLLELGAILVINFRMLQPSELAAAMSFPPDYYFHGTRDEQVRQIGNAVPVKTAKALIKSLLS